MNTQSGRSYASSRSAFALVRYVLAALCSRRSAAVIGGLAVGVCTSGVVGAGAVGTGPAPLVVATSVVPDPVFFGDLVMAEVTVDFDVRSVDPASVVVVPDFVPYGVVGRASVSHSRVGSEQTDLFRYAVQCVSAGCLPSASSLQVQFPPVLVSGTTDGRRVSTSGKWPAVFVVSRLEKSDLASAAPPYRWPTQMPPVAYGVGPALLSRVLVASGAVLACAGFALAALELLALRRRMQRRSARALTPVEAAIAYTREAAKRPEASDRRKAIGLLARALAAEGHERLADSTNGAAWSDVAPSPSSAVVVADEVESELTAEET